MRLGRIPASVPRNDVELLLDGHLLAIRKPSGLSSDEALGRLGKPLTRVSRLDLGTSGVLLAARGGEMEEPAWSRGAV